MNMETNMDRYMNVEYVHVHVHVFVRARVHVHVCVNIHVNVCRGVCICVYVCPGPCPFGAYSFCFLFLFFLFRVMNITSTMAIIPSIPKERPRWGGNLKGLSHESERSNSAERSPASPLEGDLSIDTTFSQTNLDGQSL